MTAVLALPLNLSGQIRIEPSDGSAVDSFGASVAVDGSTVVVGSPLNDTVAEDAGAVYVYQYDSGSWLLRVKLTAADGAEGDEFGSSVDIDGSTIVVGSRYGDSTAADSGAIYIFQDTSAGGNWSSNSAIKIVASDAEANDGFGNAVAIESDTILVGAGYDDDCGTNCGAAYFMIDISASGDWSSHTERKVTPSTGVAGDGFGYIGVALRGTQAVVGSIYVDGPLGSSYGAAHILQDTSAVGDWSTHSETVLSASDGAPYSYFGIAVDVQGHSVIVGASSDDEIANNAGAVYLYRDVSIAGDWSSVTEQKTVGSLVSVGEAFGSSVSLLDSLLIVGAPGAKDLLGDIATGMFYVFGDTSGSADWTEIGEVIPTPPDYEANDGIGISADMDADWIVVGAPGGGGPGAAYVYPVESDLEITKFDSDDPVPLGSDFDYVLSSSCLGPIGSYPVSIIDTLPPEVAFVGASGVDWTCDHLAGVVTCSRPGFEVGNFPGVTVTVTAPSFESDIINTASISGGQEDPDPSNDLASEDTAVLPAADLGISISDSPDPVLSGEELEFTVQISNLGPDPAKNLVLTHSLPNNSTFVSASGDGWSCDFDGLLTVTCNRPSLQLDSSSNVTVVVNAPPNYGYIYSVGNIDAESVDLNPHNDDVGTKTMVLPVADLSVLVNDFPDPVTQTAHLSYEITVANAGPSVAQSIDMTAVLSPETTFAAAPGCNESAGIVTCSFSGLLSGSQENFTIDVVVNPGAPGTISTIVSVDSVAHDPSGSDNSSVASTSVLTPVFYDGFESGDLSRWSSFVGLACSHDPCETGGALNPACDSCVHQICQVDDYCCTVTWDRSCVDKVTSVCGQICHSCAHHPCETGPPLDPLCNECVEMICAGDDYCCTVTWDRDCVDQVNSVCGLTCS